MSTYCKSCGREHHEDDGRLCARCSQQDLAAELAEAKRLLKNLLWPNVPSDSDLRILIAMCAGNGDRAREASSLADNLESAQNAARAFLTRPAPAPDKGEVEGLRADNAALLRMARAAVDAWGHSEKRRLSYVVYNGLNDPHPGQALLEERLRLGQIIREFVRYKQSILTKNFTAHSCSLLGLYDVAERAIADIPEHEPTGQEVFDAGVNRVPDMAALTPATDAAEKPAPAKQSSNRWYSYAEWPADARVNDPDCAPNTSRDSHASKQAAQAVADGLRREGLGGDRCVFPVRTWIEPVSQPDAAEAGQPTADGRE